MKILLYIWVLFAFMGCYRETKPLEGHYFYTAKTSAKLTKPEDINVNMNSFLAPENFMDFFKNGTYSLYLNQFEEGNYTLEGDDITLNPKDGSQWEVRFLEDKNLGHFEFPNAGKLTTLQKLPNSLEKDYPFIPELNKWRIKEETTLSNNELIEKFQNYTAFMQAYMRWAERNDLRLSFKNISGPLQYANNGLMMRRLKDTGMWCSYFIAGDCERIDKILRHYFDGLIIDWKYTNNRIAMLIDGLKQVSKGIEKHKEYFQN